MVVASIRYQESSIKYRESRSGIQHTVPPTKSNLISVELIYPRRKFHRLHQIILY